MVYWVELLEPEMGWVIWDECNDLEEARNMASWILSNLGCPPDEVRVTEHELSDCDDHIS